MPGRRYLTISLLLSASGGFADAGSYVLFGSFTGHITGNSILSAIYLSRGNWIDVTRCLVAVVAFLAGTAGGIVFPHAPRQSAARRLAGPVAFEIALIAAGLACSALRLPVGRILAVACLCLALGLQNGALGKVGSVSFHTTYITGVSTTLVSSLVSGKPDSKRSVLPPIIACFIAGALCGAFAVHLFGASGFAAIIAVLALAWAMAVTAPANDAQSQA